MEVSKCATINELRLVKLSCNLGKNLALSYTFDLADAISYCEASLNVRHLLVRGTNTLKYVRLTINLRKMSSLIYEASLIVRSLIIILHCLMLLQVWVVLSRVLK